MLNKQIIDRIRLECKRKNIAIGTMLEDCNLNKGFIYDVEKRNRTPSIDKISAIAEYFNCSVDYLLCRTDIPNTTDNIVYNDSNNNVAIGNCSLSNSSNIAIGSNNLQPMSEVEEEVCKILSQLSLRERSELLVMMYQFLDKHKK